MINDLLTPPERFIKVFHKKIYSSASDSRIHVGDRIVIVDSYVHS